MSKKIFMLVVLGCLAALGAYLTLREEPVREGVTEVEELFVLPEVVIKAE